VKGGWFETLKKRKCPWDINFENPLGDHSKLTAHEDSSAKGRGLKLMFYDPVPLTLLVTCAVTLCRCDILSSAEGAGMSKGMCGSLQNAGRITSR